MSDWISVSERLFSTGDCAYCDKPIWFWQPSQEEIDGEMHERCIDEMDHEIEIADDLLPEPPKVEPSPEDLLRLQQERG